MGHAPGMAGAGEGERGNETGRGICREDMDERKKERKGESIQSLWGFQFEFQFRFWVIYYHFSPKQITPYQEQSTGRKYLLDIRTALKVSPHSSVYTLCKVFDVTAVQPRHGNTAIRSHVYVGLLSQRFRLGRRKSSETMASS